MFDQNPNRENTSPLTTIGNNSQPKPLRDSVKQAINSFLRQLDGQDPEELYELVLS
ncbi:MAG: Fis family transcriptional regulator, partial [Pseudomonadota bacterium]|nr:Fis family transcriptional regulator [Pseudomonadota bacterium]